MKKKHKKPLILSLFFMIMMLYPAQVYASCQCGSYYISRTGYPEWGEGVTSIFTTDDEVVNLGFLNPDSWGCNELGVIWYDPYGNPISPVNQNHSLIWRYHRSGGFLICLETYLYITNESRELGQYCVDLLGKTIDDWELLATEYFQICVKPSFQVIVDEVNFFVTVLSNSTITDFNFIEEEKKITFNVTGSSSTFGFSNVTIPKDLLWGEYTVYVDDSNIGYTSVENSTHVFLYFTYLHTTHNIKIYGAEVVSEYSFLVILSILLITTLLILYSPKKVDLIAFGRR